MTKYTQDLVFLIHTFDRNITFFAAVLKLRFIYEQLLVFEMSDHRDDYSILQVNSFFLLSHSPRSFLKYEARISPLIIKPTVEFYNFLSNT